MTNPSSKEVEPALEPGANNHVHQWGIITVPPEYGHSYLRCVTCPLSKHLPEHESATCEICNHTRVSADSAGAMVGGISWTALLSVLERLRSKNRNPDNEWYHGWNAAIQCLINDINTRAAAPPAPKEGEARPRKIFDAGFSAKPSGAAREAADRPRIICLCGSTRFIEQFAIKTWELEREGFIVLGCTLLPMWYCKVPSHFGEATGTKEQCDKLHLRKIDLADEVLVLNIGGYIGESTANEIAYATRIGKPVKYIESDTAAASPAVPRDEDEAAEPRSKPATPLVSDCDPDD